MKKKMEKIKIFDFFSNYFINFDKKMAVFKQQLEHSELRSDTRSLFDVS